MGSIVFYYVLRKSIRNKNRYYERILPIAEEKIIKALHQIEKKQAKKEALNEEARKKYLKNYGCEKDLKNEMKFVERDEYMENLEALQENEMK